MTRWGPGVGVGVLECWSVGVELECWSVGVLECWSVGVSWEMLLLELRHCD